MAQWGSRLTGPGRSPGKTSSGDGGLSEGSVQDLMNSSLKGALLSGLVFPGLGQVFLKYYRRGLFLMFTVLICMTVMVGKAVQYALAILEKVEMGGGIPDMATIMETASQAAATSDNTLFNLAVLLVILCWLFSIVDAYRMGKKRDLPDTASGRRAPLP